MLRSFDKRISDIGIRRSRGYDFYFESYVFLNMALRGKRMVDVGGGNGLASFWAISVRELSRSLIVDPYKDGSNGQMEREFLGLQSGLRDPSTMQLVRANHDVLDSHPGSFDIALLHNSINHLGENLVPRLATDPNARDAYTRLMKPIAKSVCTGGLVVVADCARRNLLGDLHLPNPLAPSIEWNIHQSPSVWNSLLTSLGLTRIRETWTTRREFGPIGQSILGNRIGSYLTVSHFVQVFVKA